MVIVSLSLDKELLFELDGLQDELGFSGRSETAREAIKMLVSDNKEKSKLSGRLNCVLLVIHQQKFENIISKIKHEFDDIITTQMHSHLSSLSKRHRCLEIFVLEGEADKVKRLFRKFQTSGKMDYIKLVVA